MRAISRFSMTPLRIPPVVRKGFRRIIPRTTNFLATKGAAVDVAFPETRMTKGYDGIDRRDFIKLGAGLGAMVLTEAQSADAAPQATKKGAGSIDAHAHW